MKRKYKMIDLFAGCGGLEDGFLQSGRYEDVAAVEWLKPQVNTLINRLQTKWKVKDAAERVMHFDIQREEELFLGWKEDKEFGSGKGLDYYVNKAGGIDVIIGGPPCQAYSVAGRVRDENGMRDDYRNYLFEHYCSVVNRYAPKIFVFENVPGLLSAIPDGTPITALIRKGFDEIGYDIVDDLRKYAKIDASDYGVPQCRNRMIILGIRRGLVNDTQELLHRFYTEILPKYKEAKITVQEAIGDMPRILPSFDEDDHKKRDAYSKPVCNYTWHEARYQSIRDMHIYGMLADDIESGRCEFTDSKALSKLYEERVGSKSPIHRYHVLKKDEPSTTIIAHLHKDGNRFIHYDPAQCRSITPREAARLQSFDDDFDFIGSRGNAYQMIGNAVPPQLAKRISIALAEILDELERNVVNDK